jgi:hypothetical protein
VTIFLVEVQASQQECEEIFDHQEGTFEVLDP